MIHEAYLIIWHSLLKEAFHNRYFDTSFVNFVKLFVKLCPKKKLSCQFLLTLCIISDTLNDHNTAYKCNSQMAYYLNILLS